MKKLITLLLLFSVVFSAFAQDQKKPKIGVVLSGGGAKGLAHIGVLKVLEEAGVEGRLHWWHQYGSDCRRFVCVRV